MFNLSKRSKYLLIVVFLLFCFIFRKTLKDILYNKYNKVMNVEIFKLENGLTVGFDFMQDVQTVSVELCVKTGSLNENSENNGISHFLEHMAFKGTEKRTAFQIAHEIDMIGSYINAYTSKDVTCYYIKSIDKYIEKDLDILSDIIQNSIFDKKELEVERGVILQELAASLDSPEDLNYNNFMENAFKDSAIGRTVLGPKENIEKISREDILKYVHENYYAENMFLSIAGKFDKVEVKSLITKYFNNLKSKKIERIEEKFHFTPSISVKDKRDLKQMQYLIGFEAPSYKNQKDWYIIDILNTILGSGMSSRLFQEVREKRGLVYSVYSGSMSFPENGLVYIYAGLEPAKLDELNKVLKQELKRISKDISDEEMEKARNQALSDIAMSSESSKSRSARLVYSMIRYGRYISNEEVVKNIESVTKKEVMNIAEKLFSSKPIISILSGEKNVNKLIDLLRD